MLKYREKDPEVKEEDNTGEEEGDCMEGVLERGEGRDPGHRVVVASIRESMPSEREWGEQSRAGWSELPGSPSCLPEQSGPRSVYWGREVIPKREHSQLSNVFYKKLTSRRKAQINF